MIPTRWSSAFDILRRRLQQVEADQRLLHDSLGNRHRDECGREGEAAGDEPVARPAHRRWLDLAEPEILEPETGEPQTVEPERTDLGALRLRLR
jgi:hypothetical protein